jgi:transcription elongation factor GreA
MAEKVVPLTAEGKLKIETELNHLLTVRRPEIAEKIHSAKQDGDISENAGYDAAKEEQAFVEGRIAELQELLKYAVLIDQDVDSDSVVLGSTVTVQEVGCDECETYSVVGAAEADPTDGKISNESPLGKALMGSKVGAVVTIKAPAGEMRFKVKKLG